MTDSIKFYNFLAFFLFCVCAVTFDTRAICISKDQNSNEKKIVEFGWDIPDTEFVRNNISEMEKMPFDGIVMRVKYRGDGSDKFNEYIEWIGFGSEYLKHNDQVAKAIEDLQKTNFQKFSDNFIRFNVTPGNVDWFDNWDSILNNVAIAARIAKDGKLKGIFLDLETYNFPLFKYPEQKYANTKSFEEYEAQAKRRGEQFIEAINAEYLDITIFLSFGYHVTRLSKSYSLLPLFLDGIISKCSFNTKIIDGYEFSYSYKQEKQFLEGYRIVKSENLSLTSAPEKHKSKVEVGFGIWLDYKSGKSGWFTDNLDKNYFTPNEFLKSVTMAKKISDKYVWIYSERLNWWTREDIPQKYIEALSKTKISSSYK